MRNNYKTLDYLLNLKKHVTNSLTYFLYKNINHTKNQKFILNIKFFQRFNIKSSEILNFWLNTVVETYQQTAYLLHLKILF